MSPLVKQVHLASGENLGPILDDTLSHARAAVLVRPDGENGVLLPRATALRLFDQFRFTVDILPEDDGSFSLWLRELHLGASGPTPRAARAALLAVIDSYVRDYLQHFEADRHMREIAEQEPYVLRLSLAQDDAERIAMLFGPTRTVANSAVSEV